MIRIKGIGQSCQRSWQMRSAAVSGGLVAILGFLVGPLSGQSPAPPAPPDVVARAKGALAQHTGTLTLRGVRQPVEVIRDKWGVPHIYAQSTHDLFFAQGYVAAQDHLWQMELWRRNGEGTLAEVLGPDYAERDKFVRLLTFRGDWEAEMKKYHPEGPVIFAAFASSPTSSNCVRGLSLPILNAWPTARGSVKPAISADTRSLTRTNCMSRLPSPGMIIDRPRCMRSQKKASR